MTRVDMQVRLQNFFQNSSYYQNFDLNNSIQDGMDEVAATTGCVMASATIPFIANKTYYDLLTLLPNYLGVVAIFNSTINRWLFVSSIRKFNQVRIDWDTAYGTPYYFSPISHRYIAIFRKPSTPTYGNMYIFYVASAPLLFDGTPIPIPEDHIQALESYNILDLWEQNQEFGKCSEYFEEYTQNLEILRVYMKNKRNPDRMMSLR